MVTETFTAGEDFIVPDGVFSLEVELEGEAGQDNEGFTGGSGGKVEGEYTTIPGELVRIRSSSGGSGGDNNNGGASIDLRVNGIALSDRVAVAAGGGGVGNGDSTAGGDGGAGGADTGEDGEASSSGEVAGGGTQSTGGVAEGDGQDGSFGTGGGGGIDINEGGGGGAGWYGGAGGASVRDGSFNQAGSGAGGSNHDDGLATVTANERGTSTRTHGEGGLVTITYDPTPGAENLAITNTTATSNTLAWDAPTLPPEVDSVDQYRVYRDTDPGTVRADYTEVGTTPTPGFEDTGLENGTEYHYRIGADLFVPEAEGTITITDFRGV